jgi:membrane-bound serine protease (ClpP class)
MRRPLSLLVLLLVVGLWPAVASAHEGHDEHEVVRPIDVIKVEGPIDGPLLGYLEERLAAAEADGAVVALQLDSPGMLDQDAVALAQRLADLQVPVLTWVGPVPARASGGAMLVMYASSIAGVAPGSQTGPLTPLDTLHPQPVAAGLDQRVDGWLLQRGREVDRSREEEALTAQEAIAAGIATVAAPSILDFLRAVDGAQVPMRDGVVTLQTRIALTEQDVGPEGRVLVRFSEPGPVVRVQHGVASPTMVYVLLVVAIACLAFELTQPGFGFAGFAGIFLLWLGIYGATIAPPSWLGLAVLLGGTALMVLDVQLRRLGVLSWLGLAGFLAGSVLLYRVVADAIRISPWLIGAMTVGALLYYGFALTVAIQSRDRILSTQRGLIGLVGEARGRLAPDGPVYVKGAMWRGRSLADPIAPGSKIRVRGVDGLTLKVEAEPSETADLSTVPE